MVILFEGWEYFEEEDDEFVNVFVKNYFDDMFVVSKENGDFFLF